MATPYSSETPEPTLTKFGMDYLGPDMGWFSKVDNDRTKGVGAVGVQSACEFRFFFCFFDRAAAETAEPILMVDSSNDAVPPKVIAFLGHVTEISKMWAWLPKNPQISTHFRANAIRCDKWTKTDIQAELINRFLSSRA